MALAPLGLRRAAWVEKIYTSLAQDNLLKVKNMIMSVALSYPFEHAMADVDILTIP
jgi:hypothetical protein